MTIERIYIVDNELSNLRNACNDPTCKHKDIASFYADLIIAATVAGRSCDAEIWQAANQMVLGRYKSSGLIRVKELAWKIVRERQARNG